MSSFTELALTLLATARTSGDVATTAIASYCLTGSKDDEVFL